jgi:hypothetical protein
MERPSSEKQNKPTSFANQDLISDLLDWVYVPIYSTSTYCKQYRTSIMAVSILSAFHSGLKTYYISSYQSLETL